VHKQVSVVRLEVSQSLHTNPEKCQQSVDSVKETRKLSMTIDKCVRASDCSSKLDGAESYNSGSQTKKTREIKHRQPRM